MFIGIVESLYPSASTFDPIEVVFETMEECLEYANRLCNEELKNFFDNCGDYFKPEAYIEKSGEFGVIVTCKNCLDDYYFSVRFFPFTPKR